MKLNQQQLGELVGVSKRSIAAYETTDTKPVEISPGKLRLLQVSVDYLLNDEITDPKYGIEKAPHIEEAWERLGPKAAKGNGYSPEQNVALFAGGALDQEAKDAFFEAVMKAYLKCKEEARKTYGRKKGNGLRISLFLFPTGRPFYRSLSVFLYRHFDLMIVRDR